MKGKQSNVDVARVVDHATLKHLLKVYYEARKALFIWGSIGIGKSELVRQVGKDLAKELKDKDGKPLNLEYSESIRDINNVKKFVVIDIRLSQMDPSDLRGIPVWDKEAGCTRWLAPSTFPRQGYGLIFFDELNLSAPLVQASAYQMILNRQLGEYLIPDGFGLIAAGNRLEDRANIFDMAKPLCNRMGHVQLNPPSPEKWTQWAGPADIDPRIIGFVNAFQSKLFQFNQSTKEKAFATPRTWEFVSDLITGLPSTDIEELELRISSLVGEGTATEFVAFLRLRDKLEPITEYFKRPDTIPLPTDDLSLFWALMTSIVEYYKMHNTDKTVKSMVKLMKRFPEEYATFSLKLMYAIDNSIQSKLNNIPEATELAQKLWKYLR